MRPSARLAAMHTARRLAGILAAATLVMACAGTAGSPPATSPAASLDPDQPVGTVAPPDAGGAVPNDPGLVVPKPGQLDVHPIAIDTLSATADGRHVVVTVGWTSGVEPCNVLDSIVVDRGDHAFTITLREGHGPEKVACIEIAQMKRAAIDLGELDPGTYTIHDGQGRAAPIEVIVS